MEEVWKDMSLSSTPAALHYPRNLQLHTAAHSPPPSSYRALHLQDYLASVPQPSTPPPPPPPPTALTLSSTLEFTYLGSGTGPLSNSSSGDDSLMPDPFAGIFSFAAASSGGNNNKRHGGVQCPAGGDRRQRRMIKNRESAARSRARKQAYTNELELELAQLRRENEMLIKREEELNVRLAMAAQVPDRPTLQRCRSAPP